MIAPVGIGEDGQTYNINADTVAGVIAAALGAKRMLMLTDVPGVLDAEKQLIPELTVAQIQAHIASGVISGGMIPKVETCVAAVQGGVQAAVILDGKQPHVCLLVDVPADRNRDADPRMRPLSPAWLSLHFSQRRRRGRRCWPSRSASR